MAPMQPISVAVHPLVLLGVVDHYYRVCKDSNKRAVGVLLGSVSKGVVSCTNSFALPFEEDERNASVWFLDHNYLENMFAMFRKVNAREVIVGWYSSGPKIKQTDLEINELFRNYCPNSVLVVVDVKPKDIGLPTEAYISMEQRKEDGTFQRAFQHLPSEINAADAEEVGVGHLLRDIKDASISSLTGEITGKIGALKSLKLRLYDLREYLVDVECGRLPVNNEIMYNMQDIFNLLPNLDMKEMIRSFAVKTNDMMLVLYISSLVRSILALHDLIDNKVDLKEKEKNLTSNFTAASSAPTKS